jgi:hypothetical protein
MRARAGAAAAAIAVAVAMGAGVPAWTSDAAAAGPDGAAVGQVEPTGPGAATTASVTLITGDRVTLTRHADGRSSASVVPGAGREGIAFQRITEGDRLYVIPSDVAGLVPDRMDRALFDVSGLVAAGYDDAHRDTVPVIVQDAAVAERAAAQRDTATGGDRAASGQEAGAGRQPDWAALGLEPERTLESAETWTGRRRPTCSPGCDAAPLPGRRPGRPLPRSRCGWTHPSGRSTRTRCPRSAPRRPGKRATPVRV